MCVSLSTLQNLHYFSFCRSVDDGGGGGGGGDGDGGGGGGDDDDDYVCLNLPSCLSVCLSTCTFQLFV